MFRNLLKENRGARAHIGLGTCLLSQEKWNDAKEEFERALGLDPQDRAARYFAGIAYRELGKWRGGLTARGISQQAAYARANELLTSVIREDSLHQEVLYQYALLMKDEQRYGEAMKALCGQLRVKPLFVNEYTALRRLCRAALDEGRGSELLSQIPRSMSFLDLFVRAEMSRAEGKYLEAEQLLTELIQTSYRTPYQLAYLSLLRICVKQEKSQQLETLYWRAIGQIRTAAGAALMIEDVKSILKPAEMFEYATLPLDQKRDRFFAAIWNRRNPTPGSPFNPRLVDHYKRLVYAEERYHQDRERYSFFYSSGRWAPNFEFQDIGSVYIRLGPPTEVLKSSDANARSSSFVPGKMDASITETWVYEPSAENPRMMFHFSGSERSFAVGDFTPPAQPTVQTRVIAGARPGEVEQSAAPQAPARLAPDMAFWDPIYFEYANASGARRERAMDRIMNQTVSSWTDMSTSERYVPAKSVASFDIPNVVSSFRAKGGKTLVEIAYVVPGVALLKQAGDSVKQLKVESGFAVYDKQWNKISGDAEMLYVTRDNPASQSPFRFQRVTVKPDTYYVGFHAQPMGLDLIGKTERIVNARDFTSREISVSDIQLAFEIRPDSVLSILNKDGLRVVVNPSNKFSLQKPLFAYLQIYNPARNTVRETKIELDVVLKPAKSSDGLLSGVLNLFTSKKGDFVSSEVERWNSDGALVKYFVLDVQRMQPGPYILEITINDKLAVKTLSRSVYLELYKTTSGQ